MADDPTPTYRVTSADDTTTYTCLVPDMNGADGVCGHWTTDHDLMTQHMQQRHAGVMLAALSDTSPVSDDVSPASNETAQASAPWSRRRGDAPVPAQAEAGTPAEAQVEAQE